MTFANLLIQKCDLKPWEGKRFSFLWTQKDNHIFFIPGLTCVVQEKIRHTTSFLPNLPSAQCKITNPVFTEEDFLLRALPSLPHWWTMNDPADSRDAAHEPSKLLVKRQQQKRKLHLTITRNSQILELCNFPLTPSLLISKRHCLSKRGLQVEIED